MSKMVVAVPSHLAAARPSVGPLTLVYTFHESWYNDETQFQSGTLTLRDATVLETDELYDDIGIDDQSILDYAVKQGWFGDVPLVALKQAELAQAHARVNDTAATLYNRRTALRSTLAHMPETLRVVGDLAFTADEREYLELLQLKLSSYNRADQEHTWATRERDTAAQAIATFTVAPVALDHDVRTILGA